MKTSLLSALFVAASFSAMAERGVVTPASALSSYVDTESSTNVVFDVGCDQDRIFKLTFDLNATTNNNVVVALGTDANTNGILDHAEMDALVGWDSGEWFYRDRRAGVERRVPRQIGQKRFTCELTLNERKRAKRLTVADGSRSIFDGVVPVTMFSPDWNLMSVTARGLTEPDGLVVSNASGWYFKVLMR